MIISSLVEYYDQLLGDPTADIPAPGFCSRQVRAFIELSPG